MKIIAKSSIYQKSAGLLLLISVISLQGCSILGGGSYSCSKMENWINDTRTLTKITHGVSDPSRLTTHQIALAAYPLFSDDKFIPTFGRSYFAMSKSERSNIYRSLLKCTKYPYVRHALIQPFLPDNKRTGTAAVWNRYLTAAKTTTFQAEITKRKQLRTAAKQRKKQRAEQHRRMQEMKKRRIEAERQRHKETREYLANFKYEKINGPFDGITGGSFLNALYKGDAASINRLNKQYSDIKIQQYQLFTGKPHPSNAFIDMLFKHVRLLDSVKAIYLFRYQDKYSSCLRKDAVSFRLVETVPDVVYENLLGIEVARTYGYTTTTYFKVNKDFQATFRRIGKTKPESLGMAFFDLLIGGGGINLPSEFANADPLLGTLSKILKGKGPKDLRNQLIIGTKEMMENFSCDSPEIKQLEENMLKIR